MKIKSILIMASVVSVSRLIWARCPEICDGFNTALGQSALVNNTAVANTGVGFQALQNNTSGPANTAVGYNALESNTIGGTNMASGHRALEFNTSGSGNTASGAYALGANTVGDFNTATGVSALTLNTTGDNNSAFGVAALLSNINGKNNTACGYLTLHDNTTGMGNTATGYNSLRNNTTGNQNIGLGVNAGINLTNGSHNIDIGSLGRAGESNTIRIGGGNQTNTYIAGINGVTVAGGIGVIVDSSGHFGTSTSSARYKDEIKPMDTASETLLSLQPVTFRYKKELDPKAIPQFGLVAEEVEKIDPDLIARDEEGKPYSVRYEAVNAMLLNEFLKEHRTVQELKAIVAKQEAIIAQQKQGMEAVTARLEEQASQIQKMSAQLNVSSRRSPQVVLNNR